MVNKTRGVIAAGHEKTAEAGKIMFDLGGNSFDAAIAAVLASFVVESVLTSAGGGGFLLAHTQDHQNILFDFFCQTPRRKRNRQEVDFYDVQLNFGGEIQEFHIGLGSIAVPGSLAGLFEIHQRLGKLPFDLVAEPAINYAKNSFRVKKFNAYCYQLLSPILLNTLESRKIYAPEGKLLKTGQICYMTDFAETLTQLVSQGSQGFYRGEIARQIVKDLSKGGYLTEEDLENYQVITRNPLKITYRNYEILTNPPPSSGGILIAFALKLLEDYDLSKIEFGSQQHLEILAEIMRLTNQARQEKYDAYLYQKNVEESFLSATSRKNYQQQLQTILNKWGSTTHVSVLDEDGNAASVTTSNGEGSSYIVPGTGIMLNNMLGEADLNPLGFHQWQENQRISSMMSPTIVLKEGKPKIVLGSGGSNRIRTAIFQVISNLIDFELPIEVAVNSGRVHWENYIYSLEPAPGREQILDELNFCQETQIVLWEQQNMFFGGVHTVGQGKDGTLQGAGDTRREGVILGATREG
ncbi:gamma-glutamyltransferase [Gloeothece citriformis PCC 7424]|uniref:Glutathione hydrolase proenzyme n=1 Tax=Gloeothece citriformis (strain PCC 7424) TaxID=65393 RepID=B7KFH1_GLOC7|nr:gamma-glutamyltransferase [Gloeothece citriformis]ACK71887.1 gamma-glutamyltransferase [Gloeothece citriformis PCC 7424]